MWTDVCNNQWTASGGIEALPFLKQYLLYPYAPEDLAEELLKELANQSEAGGDTAGFVSTQEHFLAAPRNMRGLQDSSLIQNAHVSPKPAGRGADTPGIS